MSDWQIRFEDDVAIISRDDGKANAMLSPEFKGSMYAQYDWPVQWFSADNAWVWL